MEIRPIPDKPTLAQAVRKKYPGVYDDLSDEDLEAKVDAKYPGSYADFPRSKPRYQPWSGQNYVTAGKALVTGPIKGGVRTVIGLGNLWNAAGAAAGLVARDKAAFDAARAEYTTPRNPAEAAVIGAEQAAEFFALPGPGKVRGAARALEFVKAGAPAAGLALAQGSTGAQAAVTGALGGLPVGEAVAAAGKWAGAKAAPLVRAAIKPTVAAMSRVAGAAREGINAKAESLVRFIIENGVTTADKARRIFAAAEHDFQRLLSASDAPTDAATRAQRYLQSLEKSAARQALPAQDVAMIRQAADEMLQTGLAEDVVTQIPAVTRQVPRIKDVDVETYLQGKVPILSKRGKPDSGVPLRDDAGRRIGTRGGLSWKEYAEMNLPELSHLTPRQIAAAIKKDGDNPTYLLVKKAVRGDMEDRLVAEGMEMTVPEVVTPATTTVTRRLRESVPASEAMELARANSRWSTRKQWGEQKGAQMEASKAIERAERDAVKAAVPGARELLQRESMALQAEKVLDRAEFRAANRDVLSLPAHVVGAAELAAGKPPKLAALANWVRDNQLKLGIYADKLSKAVERGHWPEIAFYLQRAGVSITPQLAQTGAAR